VQRSATVAKVNNAPTFPAGASKLSTAGKTALKKIVKSAGAQAIYTVTGVAGKSIGVPTRFVKALAASRAAKLKAYLLKLGVKASNIIVKTKITELRVTPMTKIKVG
jgi:outer membrane protein OmpA-like peptidoglycan-associated protein